MEAETDGKIGCQGATVYCRVQGRLSGAERAGKADQFVKIVQNNSTPPEERWFSIFLRNDFLVFRESGVIFPVRIEQSSNSLPTGEKARLGILHRYEAPGMPADEGLDELTQLASQVCGTPVAWIALLDGKNQCFKSRVGLEWTGMPQDVCFCTEVVAQGALLVVPDARLDPRFAENPLVTGEPHIRFYAGVPLVGQEGVILGTLCVVDHEARQLTVEQVGALQVLGRQVMTHLELRRQSLELRASEVQRANILEASLDAVILLDRYGIIQDFNSAAVRMFGRERYVVLGRTLTDVIVPPEWREHYRARLNQYMQKDQTPMLDERTEMTALRGAADRFPAEMSLVRSPGAGPPVFIGFFRDLTVQQQAEAGLRESEARFRSTFEQAAVGIAHISVDGRFIRVNEKLSAILGYAREELLQLLSADLDVEGDPQRGPEARRAMLAGEQDSSTFEQRFRRKNGSTVWLHLVSTLDYTPAGQPNYFIIVYEDITDRKDAELRLHRLNRLHKVLSNTGEAVVRTRNRQSLFENVCRIVVQDGLLRMAFVGLVDPASQQVKPVAGCGAGLPYLNTLTVTAGDCPHGQGPVGRSCRSGVYDCCNNIAEDPRMAPWQERAAHHGFQAVAAFPVIVDGVTQAVLVLYAHETGYFQGDEIQLMTAVANDLAFALEAMEKESQRQRSQEQLKLLETCISRLNDIVLITEAEPLAEPGPRILFVNDAFVRRTGYSREEVIGKSPRILQGPKTSRAELDRIHQALRSWQPVRAELINYTKSGKEFWLELDIVPVADSNGWITHWVAVERDISERKITEARLRRLVESNAQGVTFWRSDGTILDANDAFLRMLGYSREDLGGGLLNWAVMTPPEHFELDQRSFKQLRASGVSMPYEKELFRKDGTRIPVLVGAATYEDNPEEGVCFFLDLTERKSMEQQFLRAQRMESIGTLAGGIAHDLNNALAPIMMSLDLLRARFPDAESQELLDIVSSSAQHGAAMVRQVLSFARGIEGRRMEVQIGLLVDEIQKITNETFLKHIAVRSVIPEGLWQVLGDPTQLHQVLLNLCVNARDAMPEGGTITLSASNLVLDEQYTGLDIDAQPGPYVLVDVCDTGTGMPASVIEKIFDPFFTTKEPGKGTGLGLSTTIAIIKNHGGFVRVASTVGKGSTFRFYLPALTEPGNAVSLNEKREIPAGRGQLIMVVDDELFVRRITQQTLEACGYRVILACDGAEAVALFAGHKEHIAAVITDMMMPVMDGPATIQVLRRLRPDLPIIAASGLSDGTYQIKVEQMGVNHFLPKPYTAETLLILLHELLPEIFG